MDILFKESRFYGKTIYAGLPPNLVGCQPPQATGGTGTQSEPESGSQGNESNCLLGQVDVAEVAFNFHNHLPWLWISSLYEE
jgi:hypothetical protein